MILAIFLYIAHEICTHPNDIFDLNQLDPQEPTWAKFWGSKLNNFIHENLVENGFLQNGSQASLC